METKSQSNLEVKLQSLKDQFLETLKATKLIVNPQIKGLTLTYEVRRGLQNKEGCKVIQPGLKILIRKAYEGNVEVHFETLDEQSKTYRARLEVLAETTQEEAQLTYEALMKMTQFINGYNQIHKNK